MHRVNIQEAKKSLSHLIEEALNGEEVVILKNNKPIVQLLPIHQEKLKRTLGTAKGKIIIKEDFDAPLDEFSEY